MRRVFSRPLNLLELEIRHTLATLAAFARAMAAANGA
jgi:hypothetical protein